MEGGSTVDLDVDPRVAVLWGQAAILEGPDHRRWRAASVADVPDPSRGAVEGAVAERQLASSQALTQDPERP